jgi:hypothetical protein
MLLHVMEIVSYSHKKIRQNYNSVCCNPYVPRWQTAEEDSGLHGSQHFPNIFALNLFCILPHFQWIYYLYNNI